MIRWRWVRPTPSNPSLNELALSQVPERLLKRCPQGPRRDYASVRRAGACLRAGCGARHQGSRIVAGSDRAAQLVRPSRLRRE
jgi:hypothetical protein